MSVWRSKYIILWLFSLVSVALSGQPYCDVRKFSIVDGLAANTISDIRQASDRIMWFGTWNGLSYYDGYTFTTFRDDFGGADVLSTNRIRIVAPNANNDVWLATIDFHPYVFDTHINEFIDVARGVYLTTGVDLNVNAIYPLRNGHTWFVSTDGHHLVRLLDSPHHSTSDVQIVDMRQLWGGNAHVFGIDMDSLGREWLLTSSGAHCINTRFKLVGEWPIMETDGAGTYLASADGRLVEVDKQLRSTAIALPKGVTRINEVVVTRGLLYVATDQGLALVNRKSRRVTMLSVQHPSQPTAEVTRVFVDSRQRVWIFTAGAGLMLLEKAGAPLQWLDAQPASPMLRTTAAEPFVMQDEHGTVWAIPSGGTFAYFDEETHQLQPFALVSRHEGDGSVTSVPFIKRYFVSDQGILWVAGQHELVQVNFKYHDFRYLRLAGVASENMSLCQDSQDRYWAGYDNGIVELRDSRHQLLGYLAPDGHVQAGQVAFARSGISTIYQDRHGHMWIGTRQSGLYFLKREGGSPLHFAYSPSDPASLPDDAVRQLREDSRGRLWVVTYGGSAAYLEERADGRVTFVGRRMGLSLPGGYYFSRIRHINTTRRGEVILGTVGGIITFADSFKSPSAIKAYVSSQVPGDTLSLMASDVITTLVTRNGDVYVSTLGGAVQRLKSHNLLKNHHTIAHLSALDPEEGVAQAMVEDNDGYIWVVRESSVDRYDPRSGRVQVFGPNDFDFDFTFTTTTPIFSPHTNLISIGNSNGYITFDPRSMKQTDYSPRVLFSSYQIVGNDRRIPLLNRDKELVLEPHQRNLILHFAALDYSRDYQMRYAYRVSNGDGRWISVGNRHTITFQRIPAGHYVVEVKATNTHGVWSNNVAKLYVYVRPTFFESIYGYAFMLLLGLGVLQIMLKLYYNRQKRQADEQLQAFKTKFFNDASHQLRTPLGLISGPVEQVVLHEKLSPEGRSLLDVVLRNARNMLELVDRMLLYGNDKFALGEGRQMAEEEHGVDDVNAASQPIGSMSTAGRPQHADITILVVEDNADLRSYLGNILSQTYRVIFATNGQQGLEMAELEMPDFILADITMPVMDGLTMISHIKKNSNISHIPTIILSARASATDQAEGYKMGVHAYITKPFSASYLLDRIESILTQQRRYQAHVLEQLAGGTLSGQPEGYPADAATSERPADVPLGQADTAADEPESIAPEPPADEVMQRITAYVEEHLGEPDLRIDDIAQAMAMSRSVFYSKVKTAVGMSPVDFVRHVRISRALRLISQSDETLQRIAFEVGFSDPKYFSKVFKKQMGLSPSEYRDQQRQQ